VPPTRKIIMPDSQPLSFSADSIVDTVREPMLVLSADLRVRRANRSFYRTFRVTPGETVDRLVIGKQKGPTSASKRGPPGVKCILRGASPLATATLVCSCPSVVVLLRLVRRVKRKRALRGRNPPGITRPTVCHLVHLKMAPAHVGGPGACFLPPGTSEDMPPKIPGVWGQSPQGFIPREPCCFRGRCPSSSCSSSTRGSGSFRHSPRRSRIGASGDPVTLPSCAPPGTPRSTR